MSSFADMIRMYRNYRWGEPELSLVGIMVPRDKIALDVGGYDGDYTLVVRRYARKCLTFEPNPRKYCQLERTLRGARVDVFPCALSDTQGRATLYLPHGHDTFEGCATLDPENPGYGMGLSYEVESVRLDELGLVDTIGFMKIDVEGHELAVLRGGQETLARDLPNLIIEAEERHRPRAARSLRDFLEPLGYRGYFLHDRGLLSVDEFDPVVHQRRNDLGTPRYALNFLWSVDPAFADAARKTLADHVWSRSRIRTAARVLFG